MRKIEQNRQMKRQAILAAAKSIFLSEGYTAASMDGIAAQAKLTKQTLYRYFPSKVELFQATLQQLGASFQDKYSQHLKMDNTRDAMIAFATEFMQFHLSKEHIATQRLLITEAIQAPEIVESFMRLGPDDTNSSLQAFFIQRFEITQPDRLIELWLSMLLAPQSKALVGLTTLNNEQIKQHANDATNLILASVQAGKDQQV